MHGLPVRSRSTPEGSGQHILVINRFETDLGRYHAYIDHGVNAVAYITTSAGAQPIDHELAETMITVDDLTDWDHVHRCARSIAARFGAFDQVLALSEFDLDLGGWLREALGVGGPDPDDVRRVRDKVTMKRLIAGAGLRTPRFAVVESAETVRRFVATSGLPVVLKPRAGWDSQGIILVRSRERLEDVLATQDLSDYECEEFVDGDMYHVDGLAHDGVVRVVRASRLLATCLDFALGVPFGSVTNDDEDLDRRFGTYAQRVVDALGIRTSAFHLEVFRTKEPVRRPSGLGDYDDLVFLEIGARVGGAQIPYIWREVHGIDLVENWVRMLLGETTVLRNAATAPTGGYLLMPEPPERPCRVKSARSLIERVPEMYDERLPAPGTILGGTGGAKETGGTFRFRAGTAREVERAIRRVVAEYRLEYEAIDPSEPMSAPVPARPGRVQPWVA